MVIDEDGTIMTGLSPREILNWLQQQREKVEVIDRDGNLVCYLRWKHGNTETEVELPKSAGSPSYGIRPVFFPPTS